MNIAIIIAKMFLIKTISLGVLSERANKGYFLPNQRFPWLFSSNLVRLDRVPERKSFESRYLEHDFISGFFGANIGL